MNRMDTPEGKPFRLDPPFEHIEIQYPYNWGRPNRVHVFDTRKGEGIVYGPEWARALATGIARAFEAHEGGGVA